MFEGGFVGLCGCIYKFVRVIVLTLICVPLNGIDCYHVLSINGNGVRDVCVFYG